VERLRCDAAQKLKEHLPEVTGVSGFRESEDLTAEAMK